MSEKPLGETVAFVASAKATERTAKIQLKTSSVLILMLPKVKRNANMFPKAQLSNADADKAPDRFVQI